MDTLILVMPQVFEKKTKCRDLLSFTLFSNRQKLNVCQELQSSENQAEAR
jgi:hypothetical protein